MAQFETIGAIPATSRGTSATAGAAGVQGAWSELSPSVARDSNWMTVHFFGTTADASYTLHIATGGAGSELEVAALQFQANFPSGPASNLSIPANILAGSRVSFSLTSTDAAATAEVILTLISEESVATTVGNETIGVANGKGVVIDPGTSPNTKGAWFPIGQTGLRWDTSTLMIGCNNNAATQAAHFLADIGIGAGTPASPLVENLSFYFNNVEINNHHIPITLSVPAGTGIWVRAQCSITDAADRYFDASVFGAELQGSGGGGPTIPPVLSGHAA